MDNSCFILHQGIGSEGKAEGKEGPNGWAFGRSVKGSGTDGRAISPGDGTCPGDRCLS